MGSVFDSDPSDTVICNKDNLEIVQDYVGNFIIRTSKYVLCFWGGYNSVTFYKKKKGMLKRSDYIEYNGVTIQNDYEDTIIIGKMPYSFMDKIMNYTELKFNKDIDDIMERYFSLVVFS